MSDHKLPQQPLTQWIPTKAIEIKDINSLNEFLYGSKEEVKEESIKNESSLNLEALRKT